MTYAEGQAVEVQFPSHSDAQAVAWGWWGGVVTQAGHLDSREMYHVLLHTGQSVCVGLGHLRPIEALAGLFAGIYN